MTTSSMAMSDNDELQQIAHLRREYVRSNQRRGTGFAVACVKRCSLADRFRCQENGGLIELKYKTASAVLDAEDKYNKAIAGAKNQETAKKAMDELISSVGQLELDLKIKEKNINYAKKALGLTNLEEYGITIPISEDTTQRDNELQRIADDYLKEINKQGLAVGLTDVSNYGVTPRTRDDDLSDEEKAKVKTEQTFKDLDAALKNMVDVIDNDVINALYSLGEGGKSFINSFKGFQAGQTSGGLCGLS